MQTTTDLTTLDKGGPAGVFAGRASTVSANAKSGVTESFAVVSIRGKVWAIKHRGGSEIVRGQDGMPMQRLEVVIVGANPGIAKTYFERGYQEGQEARPDCWSSDGLTPDPSAPHIQHAICETCPQNRFVRTGSGEVRGKACRDHKLLAVVPAGDIENSLYDGPMLLRIPPTSLRSLARYTDMLEAKGASLESVITGMYFDSSVAYPRIEFQVLGWVSQEKALLVVGPDGNSGMCAHPKLKRMLNIAYESKDVDDNPLDSGRSGPRPMPPPAAIQHRLAPAPAAEPEPAPARTNGKTNGAAPWEDEAPPWEVEATTVVNKAPDDMLDQIDAVLSKHPA